MVRDPIVAEVRAIREAFARRFNYDLDAIFRYLQAQGKMSDRKTVSLSRPAKSRRKKRTAR